MQVSKRRRFVVANYAGNEHAAVDFQERTSIPAMKFDVSDTDESEAAIREIEEIYGPAEILVNNAGITRDGTMQPDGSCAMASGNRYQFERLF